MPGANEILYSLDEMRTKSTELKNLADELRDEAERMNNIIAGLEGSWAGQEYQTFLGEYDAFKNHQTTFAQTVEGFGTYLELSAQRAEEADTTASTNAQQIIE